MFSKGFTRLFHQHRKKLDEIIERHILLHASFPFPSKEKAGTNYYHLFCSDPATGEPFLVFSGGRQIVEKLDEINELEFSKPLLVEFFHETPEDGGKKFYDIFFYEFDEIALALSRKFPDISKIYGIDEDHNPFNIHERRKDKK